MGLDLTIKREDGEPLGDRESVQQALSTVFPGIEFGRIPSGPEKLASADERGLKFPDVLRRHFESMPATFSAAFENDRFMVDFTLSSYDVQIVEAIDVSVYGKTNECAEFLDELSMITGWIVTHP